MYAYVKANHSSGAHNFGIRHKEKGHELDFDGVQKLCMKVKACYSAKWSGNSPSLASKLQYLS